MSERNTALLLFDILSSIKKIQEYTSGMTFDLYLTDSKTKDAVERNFEIIGKAASRIPEECRHANHQIEWRILKD